MKVRFKNGTEIQMEQKENALRPFPFGWHAEARSRSWSCGAFLTTNDNQQGRTGSKRYDGREDLRGRVLFQIGRGSGILIYRVFKLGNGCRKNDDRNLDSSEISSNTSMVLQICTIWRHGSRRLSSWWWLGSRWWLELRWLEDED
jgi:hypothetical protein